MSFLSEQCSYSQCKLGPTLHLDAIAVVDNSSQTRPEEPIASSSPNPPSSPSIEPSMIMPLSPSSVGALTLCLPSEQTSAASCSSLEPPREPCVPSADHESHQYGHECRSLSTMLASNAVSEPKCVLNTSMLELSEYCPGHHCAGSDAGSGSVIYALPALCPTCVDGRASEFKSDLVFVLRRYRKFPEWIRNANVKNWLACTPQRVFGGWSREIKRKVLEEIPDELLTEDLLGMVMERLFVDAGGRF